MIIIILLDTLLPYLLALIISMPGLPSTCDNTIHNKTKQNKTTFDPLIYQHKIKSPFDIKSFSSSSSSSCYPYLVPFAF
ncbi:hypothetical protein EYC84_005450 [Monilinia fructicola]|uniref:Secreted protein n=1 Tax=Monilinia fructicola TaxID=38448 RepID=A0A5M9K4Z2_MONFR|nr:hypothetical protein EYC84_005450 [Monilinia fructicola]